MISAANIAIFDKTERNNHYYSDKIERNIKYINDKTERYVYFYECSIRTFLKDEQTGSCLFYHQITPPRLCPK